MRKRGRSKDPDHVARRMRRRRLLRRWSLVAVPLLVVAVKLASLNALTAWSASAASDGDHGTAAKRLEPLRTLNVVQPWIAHFDEGTELLLAGRSRSAEARLRRALELVPPARECDVRMNLALALEAQADSMLGAERWDEAAALLKDAAQVLEDGDDCGEPAERVAERIEEKREQAEDGERDDAEGGEGDEEGERDDESQSEEGQPSEQAREELAERQAEARAERAQREAMGRTMDSEPGDYDDPRW